jgi:HEAT repeat protein
LMSEAPESMKQSARAARGEISTEFLGQYLRYDDRDLQQLLYDDAPQVRTAAAQILGQRRTMAAIPDLCRRLSMEKALYVRMAISNALSRIGIAAIPEMSRYIGTIGVNQYQSLPGDIFKKWDYPLPRDLVIRSIIRMGVPALAYLNKYLLQTDDKAVLSEIIDAIGYISFYSHDQSSCDNLLAVLAQYQDHTVIVWKVIRALQAFPNERVLQVLRSFLFDSPLPQHRWEAARSLGQIGTETAVNYLQALSDPHQQVQKMAELAIKHINQRIIRN